MELWNGVLGIIILHRLRGPVRILGNDMPSTGVNPGDSMHRANRTKSCMQDLVACQLEYLAILAAQSVVY